MILMRFFSHQRLPWPAIRLGVLLLVNARVASAAEDPWNVLPSGMAPDSVNAIPNAPALVKVINDAVDLTRTFHPPTRTEEWDHRRSVVKQALRRSLGLDPWPIRHPLKPRVVATHTRDGVVIENVVFESRPGFPVTANLYRPSSASTNRLPAIVSPIGHFLSAGKTATDVQARCLGLAQRGFVVLTYDAIGQGERLFMGNVHHEAGYALLPLGETIAGWMVWDTMRAIDYLAQRNDVDASRVGITGNSGGGLNTLLTSALDDRVHAAVIVGFTFEFADWIRYGGTHCTCTHFPGLLRSMEWFEVAALISPRPLLMIQGSHDTIFPIQGATRAARATESVYQLTGAADRIQFLALEGQPHAYTEPFRQPMYAWMVRWLSPTPTPNPDASPAHPLPESDPTLLCDPDRSWIPQAPTVVDWARTTALRAVAQLPPPHETTHRSLVSNWVARTVAPTEQPLGFLAPRIVQRGDSQKDSPDKFTLVSEPGVTIPGLLWKRAPGTGPSTTHRPRPIIVFVHQQGKSTVAQSGWIPPLLDAGYAVLACDLRGRGESLTRHGPRHHINFRLVATHVLTAQSLAGRRAFDLSRIVDYVGSRKDLDSQRITLVGIGDDALPVLLAAASDTRIAQIAVADLYHSLASAIRARLPVERSRMGDAWNDPQLEGRIQTGLYAVDFGSVLPGSLAHGDIADWVVLLGERPLLACQFRDQADPLAAPTAVRFRDALRSPTANRSEYSPETPLDAEHLLAWLRRL